MPFLLFSFLFFPFAGLDFPSVISNSHQTSSRYFFHSCHYNRLIVVHFPQGVGEPLETFVQTVTGGGAGGLDELEHGHISKAVGPTVTWMSTYPGTTGETLQTKLLGDFGRAHGIL